MASSQPQSPNNTQQPGRKYTGMPAVPFNSYNCSQIERKVADLRQLAPVQQNFSGPSSTFINVFSQPGTYNVTVDFKGSSGYQQQGISNPLKPHAYTSSGGK